MAELEGGDIFLEHFLEDQQEASSSSLQNVFQGSTVLLTGATGFLGSLVLEKLLRSCPEVAKVYVTARGHGDRTAHQRLKHLFSTKVFDRVRLEQRESLNKVELLDLDLGLDSHATTVKSSLTMVMHCALVTDSQATIKEAVDANIRMTMALMQLAHSCRKLEAFVVVSSTLGHAHERLVDERFYSPVTSAQALCVVCDSFLEDLFQTDSTELVIRDSTASSITLSIAEHLLRQGKKSLPLAIVRPSTLVASYKEPLSGWVPPSSHGFMFLLTLAMQGRLCSLRADPSLQAEVVPADLAASLVLAVTSSTALFRRNWLNKEVLSSEDCGPIITDGDIPIYNLTSSNHNSISWREFFACSLVHVRSVPFSNTVWYPHLLLTKSMLWFSVWFHIIHLLPALFIDNYHAFIENPNILNARKSNVYSKYQTVIRRCKALSIRTMTSQKYRDNNTQALWRSMRPADRTYFNFCTAQVDWDEYLYTLVRGVRLYCLEDSLDTIPRASRRISRLKQLHYGCIVASTFVLLLFIRVLLKVILF